MTVRIVRLGEQRREEGIALVVVLLFTAIILAIVVSTTATLALGARGGGVNERAAYQALLAAESGLNTFEVRFKAKTDSLPRNQRLRGSVTPEQINAWLEVHELGSYTAGTGQQATLSFESKGSDGTLSLVAQGTSDTARKIVLQNYHLDYVPAYNIRADAPLVSYPNVDVKGGARIEGENGLNSSGTVLVAQVDQPGGVTIAASLTAPTFTVRVSSVLGNADPLLAAGDYIKMGSLTYKVQGVQGNEATIKTLTDNFPATTIVNRTNIERIDSAVTAPFTQTLHQSSTVNVSDPTFFITGSEVFLGGMKGQVESVDNSAKTISVKWTEKTSALGPSTTTIAEGTPIRRDVHGVASGYRVDGQSQVTNGVSQNDLRLRNLNPFNPAADTETTDLFTHTFGQTKNEMLNVSPYQGWLTPVSSFDGNVSGLTLVNGNINLNGRQDLCGSGVLIVKGNLTVNGTCNEGFRGIVYVMGDYNQQGNSAIKGAVIAEGATEVVYGTECVPNPSSGTGSGPGNSCDTQVAGTGQGNGKIVYDRGALLEAGSLLSPLTFTAVPGTWRQR
ncbi:pilus assembly PilX N-terminal domain-containing protein [Deinococcus sp. YIM 77859]|uniref:pilus assembly PilX N-terminal domain-containing protein n=1 Tax=Deinococcus sp. YIM 77859 TaxID=1540221 RepID=UPI0005508E6E|nr:pilus assembly PilX N-terminal domain-containing protein [Deinococcus sp. YIM 77859]